MKHCEALRRTVRVVNLDPAAEVFDYPILAGMAHIYVVYILLLYIMHLCVCACVSVSEIVGLASQFATQSCFGCYSKLNLDSKFLAEIASHLPHKKIKNTIFLEYYIIIIAAQLLQSATQFMI